MLDFISTFSLFKWTNKLKLQQWFFSSFFKVKGHRSASWSPHPPPPPPCCSLLKCSWAVFSSSCGFLLCSTLQTISVRISRRRALDAVTFRKLWAAISQATCCREIALNSLRDGAATEHQSCSPDPRLALLSHGVLMLTWTWSHADDSRSVFILRAVITPTHSLKCGQKAHKGLWKCLQVGI